MILPGLGWIELHPSGDAEFSETVVRYEWVAR